MRKSLTRRNMFFNFVRCAFCNKKYCINRYKVGTREFISGTGFGINECPKKRYIF